MGHKRKAAKAAKASATPEPTDATKTVAVESLDRHVADDPESVVYVRVYMGEGDRGYMAGADIFSNDILVVDIVSEPAHGDIVVTLKQPYIEVLRLHLRKIRGTVQQFFFEEHASRYLTYAEAVPAGEPEREIFGVVTHVLRRVSP